MRPIALYHLHHPPASALEAPRVLARAGGTYGVGLLLGSIELTDPEPGAVSERLAEIRARVETDLESRGRMPVEALPALGDVGRSRRPLPWSSPERELSALLALLPRELVGVDDRLAHAMALEAEALALGESLGDDEAPAALACMRVAELLRALETWAALVERVRVHRDSYEGRHA